MSLRNIYYLPEPLSRQRHCSITAIGQFNDIKSKDRKDYTMQRLYRTGKKKKKNLT